MTLLRRYKQWTHAVVDLVNAPRGDLATTYRSRYLLPPAIRQNLEAAGRQAVERGLAYSRTGEISVRLRDSGVAITRTKADLACLSENDLLVATPANLASQPHAPARVIWHQALFQSRAVLSVFVGQPISTLALARNNQLPQAIVEDIFGMIGGVQLVDEHELVGIEPERLLSTHAFVVSGVGCVVWGETPNEALCRAEALEYCARISSVTAGCAPVP